MLSSHQTCLINDQQREITGKRKSTSRCLAIVEGSYGAYPWTWSFSTEQGIIVHANRRIVYITRTVQLRVNHTVSYDRFLDSVTQAFIESQYDRHQTAP